MQSQNCKIVMNVLRSFMAKGSYFFDIGNLTVYDRRQISYKYPWLAYFILSNKHLLLFL